jgi:hypothetical protein
MQSLLNNNSTCDSFGNNIATIHNTNLREKLAGSERVLLLDLYNNFLDLIQKSGIYYLLFRNLDATNSLDHD